MSEPPSRRPTRSCRSGTLDGPDKSTIVVTNGQIDKPSDYAALVVKVKNGDVVRIGDVAQVSTGTSNRLSAGYFNNSPAVIFIIFKTADANVIKTVDQIYSLMPELHRLLPADVKLTVLNDRTKTIRASIFDIQKTLIASIVLVMMVVFVFLRRGVPTLAAGVAVPLSLAGTVGLMWLSGYSLDNISLLALTISRRLRGRRRHRGHRELLPEHGGGAEAAAGRARRFAADRLHHHLHQHLARRRLHPASVHGRHDRASFSGNSPGRSPTPF